MNSQQKSHTNKKRNNQDTSMSVVTNDAMINAISESSTDVITQVDSEGNILFWTPGAEKMLGYSESEIVGKNIDVIVPQEIRDQVKRGLKEQFEKCLPVYHEETVRLSKTGERIPVMLTRVPIRNKECEVVALLAILKDISEQKHLRKERKSLQKEQENLQRQVENLERNTAMAKVAAKVAHEIRTPLGVLFLKSDLLVERLRLAFEEWGMGDLEKHQTRLEKCVSDIQRQISRLEEIANNYLHLSKTRTMERENVNIKAFLQNVAKELREQYIEGEINIESHVEEGLPPLWVDSKQIERVFFNLVRNSVEAIRQSQMQNGYVHLNAKKSDNHIILEIEDNGPGMPSKIKQAVFDPFTTTKSIGTGLGLYLAKEIVENHGGTIEIVTEEGQGTTVRFTIPIRNVEE